MNGNALVTTAYVASLASAVIALLIAFGVPLTQEQSTAILGFVAVISPLIVGWVGNRTTTSLTNPTDIDGEPLTRSNGDPAIKAGK